MLLYLKLLFLYQKIVHYSFWLRWVSYSHEYKSQYFFSIAKETGEEKHDDEENSYLIKLQKVSYLLFAKIFANIPQI